jgi:hypothetical protein
MLACLKKVSSKFSDLGFTLMVVSEDIWINLARQKLFVTQYEA